ncbi:hypothetical protein BVI434_400005 [Burkholderia vietnamiensis]|nr:hypothetical protein BVI434_400005 [Burkholderia vietnamiensis]
MGADDHIARAVARRRAAADAAHRADGRPQPPSSGRPADPVERRRAAPQRDHRRRTADRFVGAGIVERLDPLPLRRAALDQREGALARPLRADRAADRDRRRDLQAAMARREAPGQLPRDDPRGGARPLRRAAAARVTRRWGADRPVFVGRIKIGIRPNAFSSHIGR